MTNPTPDHRAKAIRIFSIRMSRDAPWSHGESASAFIDHIIAAAVEEIDSRKQPDRTEKSHNYDAIRALESMGKVVTSLSRETPEKAALVQKFSRQFDRLISLPLQTVAKQDPDWPMVGAFGAPESGDPTLTDPDFEVKEDQPDILETPYALECSTCGKQWMGKTLTEACPNTGHPNHAQEVKP